MNVTTSTHRETENPIKGNRIVNDMTFTERFLNIIEETSVMVEMVESNIRDILCKLRKDSFGTEPRIKAWYFFIIYDVHPRKIYLSRCLKEQEFVEYSMNLFIKSWNVIPSVCRRIISPEQILGYGVDSCYLTEEDLVKCEPESCVLSWEN